MRILLSQLLAILLLIQPAVAQEDHDDARHALKSGQIVALTEIIEQVEERFDGRIIEVELLRDTASGGNFVYEVELLSSAGDLIQLFFDARTGTPIAMGGQGFVEDRK